MKLVFLKVFLCLLLSALLFSSASLRSGTPDFSGEWKLNDAKSELGTFGWHFLARTIKIRQTADSIIYTQTFRHDGLNYPVNVKLSLDGKEAPSGFSGHKTRISAAFSEDGQSLILKHWETSKNEEKESKSIWFETLSLTKNGELSIVRSAGNRSFTGVYEK